MPLAWVVPFVLAAAPDAGLDDLIRRLETETDAKARLALIRSVAALKTPKAAPALSVELGDERNTETARLAALQGLLALNSAEGNDAIALAALKSDSVAVRAGAIGAIGTLKLREFKPACVRGLASNAAEVRAASAAALGRFGGFGLIGRLTPLLLDRDRAVRAAAAAAVAPQYGRLAGILALRGPVGGIVEMARSEE